METTKEHYELKKKFLIELRERMKFENKRFQIIQDKDFNKNVILYRLSDYVFIEKVTMTEFNDSDNVEYISNTYNILEKLSYDNTQLTIYKEYQRRFPQLNNRVMPCFSLRTPYFYIKEMCSDYAAYDYYKESLETSHITYYVEIMNKDIDKILSKNKKK